MQILLPLRDNRGKRLPRSLFDKLLEELSETFGGVTAYTRSPAEGQWTKGARTKSDDIVVVEVMVEKPDAYWWRSLRHKLEEDFRQDTVIVRSIKTRIH